MDSQTCNMCLNVKPANDFYTYTYKGDLKIRPDCKRCCCERTERRRARRRALGLRADPRSTNELERRRITDRAFKARHRERLNATRRLARLVNLEETREKERLAQHLQRQKDPEKRNAMERAWRAKHPEKVSEANHRAKANRKHAAIVDFTEAQRQEVLLVKGYRCDYCGTKSKHLTIDHITPLSKQGGHTLWNIAVACQSCNARKGNRPPLKPVQPLLLTIAPKRAKKAS